MSTKHTFNIDAGHSNIEFGIRHLGISTFKGRFRQVEGTVDFDEANPANSAVDAGVEVKSIDVLGERFIGHLLGEGFFDAENHPRITFRSTAVEAVGASHLKVTGDLTIRGITRPVVFDTVYHGTGKSPFGPRVSAAWTATTEINRDDYGVKWNIPMEGGLYLGDKVTLTLTIEAARNLEATA